MVRKRKTGKGVVYITSKSKKKNTKQLEINDVG
jgi:ribosomal protein L33